MASGTDRGRRQVEQILDWLAGGDGVAYVVDASGDSIVRGHAALAAAAVAAIGASVDCDEPRLDEVALAPCGEALVARRWTRPLPFGWTLGLIAPRAIDHGARTDKAAMVLARAVRPKAAFSPPTPSSGGGPAPAHLSLRKH